MTQLPPPQVSAPLQYRPSLQEAELLGCVHQLLTHRSSVHGFPSSGQLQVVSHESVFSLHDAPPGQGSPAWMLQLPPPHVSAPLQYRPSLQEAELLGCVHDPLPLHTSLVHSLPSLLQAVPFALALSMHVPEPLHVSWASQSPFSEPPHGVPDDLGGC